MTRVYEGPAIRTIYGQLVKDFGGMDAAAALLGVAKSTISKQASGDLPLQVHHWAALEDALGRFPITDMLAARRSTCPKRDNINRLIDEALRELADVAPAMFSMLSAGDTTSLRKEVPEAQAALNALISAVHSMDEVEQ
jgi:hypothetical protein